MGYASWLVTLGLIIFLFWFPTEACRKAGFSRWWGLLIPVTGFLGLILFALIEWPIHRELAWRRLAMGQDSEGDLALAQDYAIQLEMRGEWQRAIEVYEELARKSPEKGEAEFATKSVLRLRDQMERFARTAPGAGPIS